MKTFFGIVIVLLGLGIGVYFACPLHQSRSQKDAFYEINMPYDNVRKALIKGNALEEIVAYQQGRVLTKEMTKLNLSSDRLLSGWEADTAGRFTVAIENDQVGQLILSFNEESHVSKTGLQSTVTLAAPHPYIQHIRSDMKMTPNGETTIVDVHVELIYERRVPWFMREFMDRKVDEATDIMVQRNKEAMGNFMAKAPKKRFMLPLKRN
jgi:hypothetical protein